MYLTPLNYILKNNFDVKKKNKLGVSFSLWDLLLLCIMGILRGRSAKLTLSDVGRKGIDYTYSVFN